MGDLTVPPAPRPLASRAFLHYVRRLARGQFAAVHHRIASFPAAADGATVLVANHTSWWDGFLAYLLGERLGLSFRVLMEAEHLERYRFFLQVGALPLDRRSLRARWRDLRAARAALAPGVGLWIFPQGARRPAAEPIGQVEAGVGELVRDLPHPVHLVPVGFRYAYLGEQQSEAFILAGTPWSLPAGSERSRRELAAEAAGRLRDTLDELDGLVAREAREAFDPLLAGRLSLNKRLDRVRHRLGLLDGAFEARNG